MTIASNSLGAQFLNRLNFRHKLLLLPLLAGIGFVVVLLVSIVFNLRNQRQLELIEKGYYPAVSNSEALNQRLSDIQRALQDAVAAHTTAARHAFASLTQTQRRTTLLIIAIVVICVAVLIAVSLYVAALVTASLQKVVGAVQSVAGGDLTAEIDVDSRDELG